MCGEGVEEGGDNTTQSYWTVRLYLSELQPKTITFDRLLRVLEEEKIEVRKEKKKKRILAKIQNNLLLYP